MKVCIIGGGKVGFHLANKLMHHNHQVVVVEQDKKICYTIANQLDTKIINGDGSSIDILNIAKVDKSFDVFIATTGIDEVNLVSCQLAKKVFGINKTVARVNNPKNTIIMSKLGVDFTVSTTSTIAKLLEIEAEK